MTLSIVVIIQNSYQIGNVGCSTNGPFHKTAKSPCVERDRVGRQIVMK